MKKVYIIAGEASGDLHGSNLIQELNSISSDFIFRGFGGNKMEKNGLEIVVHYRDIAFMGVKEVIMNFKTISQTIKLCKSDILSFKPEAIILIDYPGFNLRIAKFASKQEIKVIYYISPQIWAWKESRIKSIRKYIDKMICILPYEKDFYKKLGYEIDYVGHPLLDEVNSYSPNPNFYQDNQLDDRPIIAVLPGSRKQEIYKILPIILQTKPYFPDYQFIIAGSSNIPNYFYKNLLSGKEFKILYDKTYDILYHAKAGVIASGTATLEAALFNLPLVVCYNTTKLNYILFKLLANLKNVSLINLILNKNAVKELIQSSFNELSLKAELENLLNNDNYSNKIISDFQTLRELLRGEGASKRAAESVYAFISGN